ncbi:DUF7024 domain-containing protein [Pseudoduganella sp. OTU4001]|uniref:DUF7024 domain-containing protein n=1 Tax=Pseudoduganella sp. OTU4001 TaxID=3043854 RepID=UPI00313D3C4C
MDSTHGLTSRQRNGFAAAILAVFVYLLLRNSGVYPMVFADEWYYSQAARLQPLAKSTLPSYLYLALFGHTSQCGTGFLDCARILNALLFVAAAPFLYLLARRVCGALPAAALAVLCLLAPINSYTVYFMPEAMYFFGFCVLSWAALAWRSWPPLAYGAALGFVLGVLAVVKVHALFLLPAVLAFMVFVSWGPGGLLRFARMAPALLVVALATKAALGYMLAGPEGMQLLGSFYGDHANQSKGNASIMRLLEPALGSLRGHLMALALLYGLPLAAIAAQLAGRQARQQGGAELRALQVWSVLALGAALGVTVLFTASIAKFGESEAWRLHMRYYNFVFPLLWIAALAPLQPRPCPTMGSGPMGHGRGSSVLRVVVAGLMLGGVLYAWHALQPRYLTSFVDSPELQVVLENPLVLPWAVLAQALLLVVWAWRPRWGAVLLLCVALPVWAWQSDRVSRMLLERARTPDAYDRGGLLVQKMLSREEAGKVVVAGDGAGLLRALFHIDAPGASFVELQPGAPLALNEIPARDGWFLVVGQHVLPAGADVAVKADGFALLRTTGLAGSLGRVEFREPLAGGVLAAVEGLAPSESWGAWSDGAQVTLTFAQPLPRAARIVINANAFGPNLDADFTLVAGGSRTSFRLPPKPTDRVFDFETDGTVRTVVIQVPKPTAPADIGQGGDTRKLGLALNRLELAAR